MACSGAMQSTVPIILPVLVSASGSESMMSRLLAHREGPVPSLSAFCPGIPDELEAVYQRAMAKDRKQRFQSMEELIDALSKIEVDEEPDASSLATVEIPDDGNGGFIQVPD